MDRITKFLLDQLLENIMKFTQAHYDTTNSVQLNLEHCENIDRIHDAEYACKTNTAVRESLHWLAWLTCVYTKLNTHCS